MTRASVIVPSYRGARWLPGLLLSLTAQSHDDHEVVVVIDGDVDDSAALVARHVEVTGDTRVRAHVLPENRGRVTALNEGFTLATGDVLVRCDDDLRPGPGWLAAHVAAHAQGLADPADARGVVGLCRNVYDDTPYARAYGAPSDRQARAASYALGPDAAWRAWGANVSLPRTLWDTVGPYDLAYAHYGFEDVDYGYRIYAAGHAVVVLPELEVEHLGPAATASERVSKAFQSGAASVTFTRLHGPVIEPRATDASAWARLVRLGARLADRHLLERMAAGLDATSRWLPDSVVGRAAALLVETADVSGHNRALRKGEYP